MGKCTSQIEKSSRLIYSQVSLLSGTFEREQSRGQREDEGEDQEEDGSRGGGGGGQAAASSSSFPPGPKGVGMIGETGLTPCEGAHPTVPKKAQPLPGTRGVVGDTTCSPQPSQIALWFCRTPRGEAAAPKAPRCSRTPEAHQPAPCPREEPPSAFHPLLRRCPLAWDRGGNRRPHTNEHRLPSLWGINR